MTLPTNFTITTIDGILLIYCFKVEAGKVKVAVCISVAENLSTVVSVDNVNVPADTFKNFLTNGLVTTTSQLINLAARMKTLSENLKTITCPSFTKMAVSILKERINILTECSPESEKQRKLEFVLEQAKLLTKSKFHCHYSPGLTIMSYIRFMQKVQQLITL